jgi:hypothetical protein
VSHGPPRVVACRYDWLRRTASSGPIRSSGWRVRQWVGRVPRFLNDDCLSGRRNGRVEQDERERGGMKWVAGALVVLAVAIVAAAFIVTRSQRPINLNIDGQLTMCTTQSLSFGNGCR